MKIKTILVANRGEVAVRIIRAARSLGIKTILPYLSVDKKSRFVQLADISIDLGDLDLRESFLSIDNIIEISNKYCVDAVHPGIGFLSESSIFAQKVRDEGFIFIGPSNETLRICESKKLSKDLASGLSIPVIPEFSLDNITDSQLPVILKATHGGGGKGISLLEKISDLQLKLQNCLNDVKSFFGESDIIAEKYIANARHVEVQVFGDGVSYVHLFERDCTSQVLHQKLIEESEAFGVDLKILNQLYLDALKISAKMQIVGPVTVEFLVDSESLEYYFLEINPRLQIEHPVTEMSVELDIVKEQIKVSSGSKLSFKQEKIKRSGFCIEARINAINCYDRYMPSVGEVSSFVAPDIPNVRVDTFLINETVISDKFDSLLAKVIVKADTRKEAISLLQLALRKIVILGVHTNIEFLVEILNHSEFVSSKHTIDFAEKLLKSFSFPKISSTNAASLLAAYYFFHTAEIKDLAINWNELKGKGN